ncbi:uncharacterized protein LOC141856028 [Brevipalpus obovatus]|uniref:uncharacterized protein LOC141856028 n=1 Tax=Brevipalpus obovatus TaxID=246614 RepID=UPI003D9F5F2E
MITPSTQTLPIISTGIFVLLIIGSSWTVDRVDTKSISFSDCSNTSCLTFTIKAKCQVFDLFGGEFPNEDGSGLRVECSETNGKELHRDVDNLRYTTNRSIVHLKVRDSKLNDMTDLPSGLVGIRSLILDNTNIDLQVIKESAEMLSSLTKLKIFNENYTTVPDLFYTMHELSTLWLNDIGIVAISDNAFQHLDDSIVELSLRENKLRTIPQAVTTLMKIETLDLTDNEIYSVSDGIANDLSRSLNRVKRIKMNRLNCSCEFAKSRFARWVRENAIKDVECLFPARFRGYDVWSTPIEDFCSSQINIIANLYLVLASLVFLKLIGNTNNSI